MTMQLLPSEFPSLWGKFFFFFYQCVLLLLLLLLYYYCSTYQGWIFTVQCTSTYILSYVTVCKYALYISALLESFLMLFSQTFCNIYWFIIPSPILLFKGFFCLILTFNFLLQLFIVIVVVTRVCLLLLVVEV